MEPSSRLYACMLCHKQALICSFCDRGQIYCSKFCSSIARKQSQKLSAIRYQKTLNGKLHHAARQAKYRRAHKKIVTHQGSPVLLLYASISLSENKTNEIKNQHTKRPFICCVCKKPLSTWVRHGFLPRREGRQRYGFPQAP